MSCEHCGCDCYDYEEGYPESYTRLHEHPIGKGKSGLILDSIDGADIEVVNLSLTTMLPEDLMGLPVRTTKSDRTYKPSKWLLDLLNDSE